MSWGNKCFSQTAAPLLTLAAYLVPGGGGGGCEPHSVQAVYLCMQVPLLAILLRSGSSEGPALQDSHQDTGHIGLLDSCLTPRVTQCPRSHICSGGQAYLGSSHMWLQPMRHLSLAGRVATASSAMAWSRCPHLRLFPPLRASSTCLGRPGTLSGAS